jgi:pyruvate decarboxylase
MGKSAVNETLPNYRGVYAGEASDPGIREQVESSDLILSIGAIKSDFNTAGFSYRISQLNTIDFHSEYINVKYSGYSGVRMKNVLRKVVDTVDMRKLPAKRTTPTVHNAPNFLRVSRQSAKYCGAVLAMLSEPHKVLL